MTVGILTPELSALHIFNQFWAVLFFIIPMILVARAVVAGTRYSAILIVVIFGLVMGFLLIATGVTEPGLRDFPMMGLIAQSTIIALSASFFVGGQELRRIFSKAPRPEGDGISYATEEVFFGTGRTHVVFIVRAFFLLLGIEATARLLAGTVPDTSIGRYYPVIAYLGIVLSVILIDNRATIPNKREYLLKGLAEIIAVLLLLLGGYFIAQTIRPVIALPQIFFVMLLSAGLGAAAWRWRLGPTLRCLLFAGIPVVLAANFIIGGSRIPGAFELPGMGSVLVYGLFGQMFWMFGGIALLLYLGRSDAVRIVGPGMAGALSHAGLTGACTAGDLGKDAAQRAPIMINIPFFGHIFVFSILAVSASRETLWLMPSLLIVAAGIAITALALRNLARSGGQDDREVKALMQFSFGWQITAVFGSLLLLAIAGMPFGHAMMATSSALSHFGLFAAIQEGMGGEEAAAMIAFVFAMPFLIHPLVFFIFGRAMEQDGHMPKLPIYILAALGTLGITAALLLG